MAPNAAPDAVAPPPGHLRFPLFDSLRAIAVLSVLLVHVTVASGAADSTFGWALAHLDIGLTIFFLISGFLLYRPFVAARFGHGPPVRVRDYARRRGLRILPAYWLALTLLAVYPGLSGVFDGDWWVYYGFMQAYPPLYDQALACGAFPFNCGIAPAWSLDVELTFYIALPLLALAAARLTKGLTARRSIPVELVLLGGLALISVGARVWAVTHLEHYYLVVTLASTFYWFALGMALAVLSVALRGREAEVRPLRVLAARPWLPWAAALALYAFMGLVVLSRIPGVGPPSVPRQLAYYLGFGVIAFLLLLPAVFEHGRGLPQRVLANPILSWIGLISYGIFLWHWPIIFKLTQIGALDWVPGAGFAVLTATAVTLSVAAAAASYYLVERPILGYKDRRSDRDAGRGIRQGRLAAGEPAGAD